MKTNYTALIFNALDDKVEIYHLNAKDEQEAYQIIEENGHNLDLPVLLTQQRLKNLIEQLEKIK